MEIEIKKYPLKFIFLSVVVLILSLGGILWLIQENNKNRIVEQQIELLNIKNLLISHFSMRTAVCEENLKGRKITIKQKGLWLPIMLDEIRLQKGQTDYRLIAGKFVGESSRLKMNSIKFIITQDLGKGLLRGELLLTPENSEFPYGLKFIRISQNVEVKNEVINKCIPTLVPSCPSGQIYQGFGPNGDPICLTVNKILATNSLNCGAGKILQGFNTKGMPICVLFQRQPNVIGCPSGQYMESFNSKGEAKCIDVSAETIAAARAATPLSVKSIFNEVNGTYDLIFRGPPKTQIEGQACANSGKCSDPYQIGPLDEDGNFTSPKQLDNVSCKLYSTGNPCTITYRFTETKNNTPAAIDIYWK